MRPESNTAAAAVSTPDPSGAPLGNPRHRTLRLEDGELVVALRGASGPRRCDRPHAGLWGPGVGYVFVQSPGRVRRRAGACLAFDPGLEDRSSDAEVLILGTVEQIARLVSAGPAFCRARVLQTARDASRLAGFRFGHAAETRERDLGTTISPRDGSRAGDEALDRHRPKAQRPTPSARRRSGAPMAAGVR